MEEIGICIKNASKQVVFQNTPCQKLCGEKRNHSCRDGCMAFYQSRKYPRKTQYFTNAKVNDKPFDLLFVEDEESITTLLIPITEQYRKDAVNLEQCGLTRSEMTIALFVCQGKTNSEISNQLHISASTLKSHLNHIYSKVDREFLQSRRKKT